MREVIEAMVQPLMSTDAPPCEICYSQIEQLSAAGFVIVPKEPSEAMIKKGAGWWLVSSGTGPYTAERIYRAMIEASQESE